MHPARDLAEMISSYGNTGVEITQAQSTCLNPQVGCSVAFAPTFLQYAIGTNDVRLRERRVIMSPASATADLAKARVLALIPFGIALNMGLGTLMSTLKIPLYGDAVATIAVTLLAGFRAGAIVGVASFLVGGVLINPVLPWFSGTQFLIAAYTAFVAKNGWLDTRKKEGEDSRRVLRYLRIVIIGIILGVLAGIVSAPVIVALFSGLTGSGPSLVVAFLLKSGQTLYKAVLLSGVASEPLDKTIQLLLALALIRALPPTLKQAFGGGYLKMNGLLYQ